MKTVWVACILLLGVTFAVPQTEAEWEQLFMTFPSASFAYEHLSYYTSLPHVAGTPEDHETAQYTHRLFQSYGLDSRIEEETVLLTYPISRRVAVVSPANSTFECIMQEDYEPSDPTSGDPRVVPTFNGYAPAGNVTAPLVYVNYASVEDFAYLKSIGVDVTGKIGIARYGTIFRGTKAMIAQENGMIGLLIYSDPAEDGYAQGPVYPEGPWRSNTSVQRGSVQFLSICPGNPTRSICVNEKDRSSFSYTQVLPKIPVQPLSYSDALPLLDSIRGTVAPQAWIGALPINYYIGPGPGVVNIDLQIKWVNTTIWNVIAEYPAATSSPVANEIVLVGNHRDAWTFGAVDPNSGTSVMLEVARSFGEMKKLGYTPQRKLVFCSWDAEEYGLLGSTAFAERHNATLVKNAVAYINLDTAVAGTNFAAAATPSLKSLIRNVTQEVISPAGGRLSSYWNGAVGPLGSGSDYTAFLDHYGIPSMNLEFDGDYGVYHSVYDSMHWMNAFGDPTYNYYVTLAQVTGLSALKLAGYQTIAFNFTDYAVALQTYLTDIQQYEKLYGVTLDYTKLTSAVTNFTLAATSVQQEIAQSVASGSFNAELNNRLLQTERQFIGPGLAKRPYYKHVIQAPGLYQGYAPELFPGVSQAIQARNQQGGQYEVTLTALYINKAAKFLKGSA